MPDIANKTPALIDCRTFRQRQRYVKRSALVGMALEAEFAPVQFDDLLADMQPQAGARQLLVLTRSDLLELLEQQRLLVFRDSGPMIRDFDPDHLVDCPQPDFYAAAVVAELGGIGHELAKHLHQALFVAAHPNVCLQAIEGNFASAAVETTLVEFERTPHQGLKIQRPLLDLQLAGFDLGQVEDVVNDIQKTMAFRWASSTICSGPEARYPALLFCSSESEP